MGRFLLYTCVVALALFVLAAAFLFKSGGQPRSAATPLSVHDLAVAPEAHSAELVVTTGVLRFLHEPTDHFVVTADGLGIVVRFDEDALRPFSGLTVRVTGRFGFDEDTGTYIDAESVAVAR